jgi:hypothetical protein
MVVRDELDSIGGLGRRVLYTLRHGLAEQYLNNIGKYIVSNIL